MHLFTDNIHMVDTILNTSYRECKNFTKITSSARALQIKKGDSSRY